jgi:hypothetical protein
MYTFLESVGQWELNAGKKNENGQKTKENQEM